MPSYYGKLHTIYTRFKRWSDNGLFKFGNNAIDEERSIADKGYDYSAIRTQITALGKTAVIPRRKGAVCPGVREKERYNTRSAIERFFGKIKENKRLTLRFDKLDVTFFSFFALGCLKVLNLIC